MKDLAGQDYSKKSTIDIPPNVARACLFVLVVLVVLFFIKYRFGGNSIAGVSSDSSVILSEAPRGLVPVGLTGSNLDTTGVNLTTQNATMKIVRKEVSGSATASRSFGAGIFNLSVSATLPDPKNTFYEVWLTDGSRVVPIDYMQGSGTSWSLNLSDTDKYSKLDRIWITLERTKDNLPEEHIVEGTF